MFFDFIHFFTVCGILAGVWTKEFTSYWNIPTFSCSQRFNLPLLNVTESYGIKQNIQDNFRGNQISILYDPGVFPAIIVDLNGKANFRNGGVPQEGDLRPHLQKFQKDVETHIPDTENNGLIIIDFELWRPMYKQNFGKLKRYQEVSKKLVQNSKPFLSPSEVAIEADRIFSEHAKLFMIETIAFGRRIRPKAKWGYYGLPFCFNGRGNVTEDCENKVQDENDSIQWLYDSSDVIFPSVYLSESITHENRPLMVRGRVKEALRVATNVKRNEKPLVIAYHRYKFPDTLEYLNKSDHLNVLEAVKEAGADGVVLWGAWNDVNTIEKCLEFYEYLENTFGPCVRASVPTTHSTLATIEEVLEPTITSFQPTEEPSSTANIITKTSLKLLVLLKLIMSISSWRK